MAKQQRGSARAQNRPATPPSGKSAGQKPTGQKPSGQKGSAGWQPKRVSASKKSSGPNRTVIATIAAIVVGLAIVGFVAIQQLSKPTAVSTTDLVQAASKTPASVPVNGRTLGQANAPVTIDLYGDFRCSACYNFTEMGTEDQLVANEVASGKAKIVWHDFLTIDLHDGTTASRDAANAAWCAADQNKFWTMHDWLYANQSPTEDPSAFTIPRLLAIGQAAGMDMATFQPCVENGTHNQAIADEQSNVPSAVTGTPTVFVNGQVVGGNGSVPTYAEIQTAVAAAIGGSSSPSSSAPASAAPSTSVAPSG
jgi:protein-disulfide isomerase